MSQDIDNQSLLDLLKHCDLQKYLPVRIVLREPATGTPLMGYTEESWCMSWSHKFVKIYWSGPSNWGDIDGIADAKRNAELTADEGGKSYDPLSPDCPVLIDWNAWFNATTKYDRRNAPFYCKKYVK